MVIYLKNCFYALICTKFDYIAPVSSLGYQQIIFLLLVETELHASLPTKFSQHPWRNFGSGFRVTTQQLDDQNIQGESSSKCS